MRTIGDQLQAHTVSGVERWYSVVSYCNMICHGNSDIPEYRLYAALAAEARSPG